MPALPSLIEVDHSIARVQESIRTHKEWKLYREQGGTDDLHAGDLSHHEQCLVEYAQVIKVLCRVRGVVKAKAAKEQNDARH